MSSVETVAFPVGLVQFTPLAVEGTPGQAVAALAAVELVEDTAPVIGV